MFPAITDDGVHVVHCVCVCTMCICNLPFESASAMAETEWPMLSDSNTSTLKMTMATLCALVDACMSLQLLVLNLLYSFELLVLELVTSKLQLGCF